MIYITEEEYNKRVNSLSEKEFICFKKMRGNLQRALIRLNKPFEEITRRDLVKMSGVGTDSAQKFYDICKKHIKICRSFDINSNKKHSFYALINGERIKLKDMQFFCEHCGEEHIVMHFRKKIGKSSGCISV